MSLIQGSLSGYRTAHEGQLGDAFTRGFANATTAVVFTGQTAGIFVAGSTAVPFDTDTVVTGFTKTAAGRFAVQQAGYYLVMAHLELGVLRNWGIYNGTTYLLGSNMTPNMGDQICGVVYLAAGAELSIRTPDAGGLDVEGAQQGFRATLGAIRIL